MKRYSLIALLIFYCIAGTSCKNIGDGIVETLLRKEAEEFNKKGGIMLDKETRMDSMEVKPGRCLVYHYTIINYSNTDLDTNILKKGIIPNAKEVIVNDEKLKSLRDRKVTFVYLYHDKNNKYSFGFKLTPADYGKK